jgi:hypothetical protein
MMRHLTKQRFLSRATALTSVLLFVLFGISCRNSLQQKAYIDITKMKLGENAGLLPARVPLSRVEAFGMLPDSIKTRIGPKMANPGRAFNAGDVSIPGIPNRRLIFAEAYNQYYLVHYETGGEAHGFIIAFFELSGARAIPLWAHAGIKFADASEFEKEMETRPLENEVDTIYSQ